MMDGTRGQILCRLGFLGFFMLSCFLSAATRAQSSLSLSRNCRVLSQPSLNAREVCTKLKGSPINGFRQLKRGFAEVLIGECRGYVVNSCIARRVRVSSAKGKNFETAASHPAESVAPLASPGPWRLGVLAQGDGAWAKVGDLSQMASGWGFAGGVLGQYLFSPSLRVGLAPSFQYLHMSRNVGASGSINDPDAILFQQSATYLGLTGLLGVNFAGAENEEGAGGLQWWGDFGGEILLPLSGSQSTASGLSANFSPGRLVYLIAGPSVNYAFSRSLSLDGGVQFTFNLAGISTSKLLGARLALALKTTL